MTRSIPVTLCDSNLIFNLSEYCSLTMVWIPKGSFVMGCGKGEPDEKPEHEVTVNGFWIGETPITNAQWSAVFGQNRAYFKEACCPVEMVSWFNAVSYIEKLNVLTGRKFRLPTEAEWEYAAGCGKKHIYAGSNFIDLVGWHSGNSSMRTHPVKEKKPNDFGLYDMSGNVWEWCADWYNDTYYHESPAANPQGPAEGVYKVQRGGGWDGSHERCRVCGRGAEGPSIHEYDIGMRVVLAAAQ